MSGNRPFPRLATDYYLCEDVVNVARDLLGKFLVTNFDGALTSGMIVETEAYRGPDDKASHAFKNRRTNRTEVMFKEGGLAYVYLCYGIHHLFNVVSGKTDQAHAVLIRALQPIDNIPLMLERRNFSKARPQLTAGPGVMSKAMGIKTQHSGLSLVKEDSPIWIEDRGIFFPDEEIVASQRVGVAYAQECASWPWRFRVANCDWTSPAK